MVGVTAAVSRVFRFTATFVVVALSANAVAGTVSYADTSEVELRALSANWDELSGDERRALLTEVHRRMVAAGKKPMLRIRAERRFGYRVPQPDGSVVAIERRQQIIRYREIDPAQPFGVGFEERRRNRPIPVSDVTADAPRPGSAAALERSAASDANGSVPQAADASIYQLPLRQVRVTETQR